MHDNSLIVLDSGPYDRADDSVTPQSHEQRLPAQHRHQKATTMHIAILTFEGYNELDSLIALGVLNRVRKTDWRVSIASPSPRVRSMNGVVIESHVSLDEASAADAVIVGSGRQTREVVADQAVMARLQLDPSRQLLGAQCSGALVLARLGLLAGIPACTDTTTKPWVQEAGVEVLDQPFFAKDNVATAGGCLSSAYLAAWMIARLEDVEAAISALHYVAPVGEKEDYVARAMRNVTPYLRHAGRPWELSLTTCSPE
jgi:transcriptional regulator GlxA family with amidase domain